MKFMLTLSLLFISFVASASPEDDVQTMYVSYYGRPADPGGFEYWVNRLSEEGWSTHFINAFGNSAEYVNRFGGLSSAELVDNLYIQILNRHAEPGGLNWYTNLLDTGQRSLSEIAVEIAGGVQNDDVITLDNKVYVAHYFTEEVARTGHAYGDTEIDDAVSIVALVDSSDQSVSVALNAVDSFIGSSTNEEIWVHIDYMGEGFENRSIGGICLVPTGRMLLLDASRSTLEIEPYGCIMTHGSPCNYYYSAWAIDEVSVIQPSQAELDELDCGRAGTDAFGQPRCIRTWYSVQLPTGFHPVEYVAGCATYYPFEY